MALREGLFKAEDIIEMDGAMLSSLQAPECLSALRAHIYSIKDISHIDFDVLRQINSSPECLLAIQNGSIQIERLAQMDRGEISDLIQSNNYSSAPLSRGF